MSRPARESQERWLCRPPELRLGRPVVRGVFGSGWSLATRHHNVDALLDSGKESMDGCRVGSKREQCDTDHEVATKALGHGAPGEEELAIGIDQIEQRSILVVPAWRS